MSPGIDTLRSDLRRLCERVGRRVQIMEVCGTHTVSIFRNGLRALLPENLRLISGPGCPVCVTAQRHIDAALTIAARPEVVLATYGDMLRVPGRLGSLEGLKARGACVEVIQSARTAVQLARNFPSRMVVFFAVGFETTAPATAAAVLEAARDNLANFTVLPCHKRVVPAMEMLLEAGDVLLDGFLCPGHVSVITGAQVYRPLVERFGKGCVVAGFEPAQILLGLVRLLHQIEARQPALENVYAAAVRDAGNPVAQELLQRVFVTRAATWRALGEIPASGLELAPAFERFDALRRFDSTLGPDEDDPACRCGDVIRGLAQPDECALFAHRCTPSAPVGPCMVSSEGTCAAWYKYQRTARSPLGV